MKLQVKKILSPLILLPVFLPIILAIQFTVKRENIRHEIKEQLEEGLFHTIRVNNNAYKWVKPGKEILVSGQMFDVKSHRILGNETEFTGLYDAEETALNKAADNLWQKQTDQNNILLSELMQLLQITASQSTSPDAAIKTEGKSMFIPLSQKILTIYSAVTTPPPRC